VTNRLTFSSRFGFNISARFKGVNNLPAPASTARKTPQGDPYNYDDGYVLIDNSGNFGGQTWYWGYDDSSRQIAGNNILMGHNALAQGAGSVTTKDDPGYGAELVYRRLLPNREGLQVGFELAANYLNLSLSDSRSVSANVVRTSDPYPFTPGTMPPAASPGAPYQGSFQGPGFVIGATPGAPITTTEVGGATIAGHRQLDANIWGFRLGPCLEMPLGDKLKLSLSGGFAGALIDADASWSETITIGSGGSPHTLSGGGQTDQMVYGFYVGVNAFWELSPRWNVVAGMQYQDLNGLNHSFGGRQVQLDLSQSFFVTLGLSFNF